MTTSAFRKYFDMLFGSGHLPVLPVSFRYEYEPLCHFNRFSPGAYVQNRHTGQIRRILEISVFPDDVYITFHPTTGMLKHECSGYDWYDSYEWTVVASPD